MGSSFHRLRRFCSAISKKFSCDAGDTSGVLALTGYRFEISEKVDSEGRVVEEIDKTALIELARKLKAMQVDSVGITFNNAYANPANEKKAKEILQNELSGIPIKLILKLITNQGEAHKSSYFFK
ncbi:hypothetical protein JCM15765_35940 [Paradesulfitobacterium aromaticivorans]